MNRGDIYLVHLDTASGRALGEIREVVIISPAEFNAATKLPVILPITNDAALAHRIGFVVRLTDMKTRGAVRCDQPRVLDVVARNGRKVDALPQHILDEVLARVATIFE